MTLKEPIVEGAYYEREDGVIAPAKKGPLVSTCTVAGHVVYRDRGMSFAIGGPSLTRRVYLVHTDPAEVVAELRERAKAALSQTSRLYVDACADLVAKKLGVKS